MKNKTKTHKTKTHKSKTHKSKTHKSKTHKTKTHKTKTHKKYNENDDKTTKNVIIETIYEKYANYIQEIIKNDKKKWDFKSNPLYNDILEHLPKHFSYNYFSEIKKNFYKFYINNKDFLIQLCNTNDMYGKPKQMEFNNFTKCSSTNLRYILHSLLILTFMKKNNIKYVDIIEIGGGYGGLSFYMNNISRYFNIKIKSYCIFDLPDISLLQESYLKALNTSHNMHFYQINNYKNLKKNSFLISNYAFSEIQSKLQYEYTQKILNEYISYGFLVWNMIPIYEFINNKIILSELEYPDTSGDKRNFYVTFIPKNNIIHNKLDNKLENNLENNLDNIIINKNKNKNIIKDISNISKNKIIRIITSDDTEDYKNDINVYLDIFMKLGFKTYIHILKRDKLNKINIKYDINPFYDINLFIDKILPLNDYYNKQYFSFFKKIFPSSINIFAANMNTFINYKQLYYIDIVLCSTKICYNFINFIKKENKYKFNAYYTNFTTIIPKHLLNIKTNDTFNDKLDSIKDLEYIKNLESNDKHIKIHKFSSIIKPLDKEITFIHIADNQKYKNTSILIHCWLKYKNIIMNIPNFLLNVYPELHIICNGICFTTVLLEIKKLYEYDLLTKYKFETIKISFNKTNTILKYNNLYLYLDLTPNDIKYKELIKKANVSIYPSKNENYPHNINMSRYFNTFVITMNFKPMNELIIDKDIIDNTKGGRDGGIKDNTNGYLLKNIKYIKTNKKKLTNFIHEDLIPDIEELKDSIVWCIKNMFENANENNHELTNSEIKNKNYILSNKISRQHFDNDKKDFENNMVNIVKNNIINIIKNNNKKLLEFKKNNINNNSFNTLSTIFNQPSYKFYPENEDDNYCKYINIRGILKSCDIHSLNPISSIHDLIGYDFDFINSKNNSIMVYSIYICNTAIPKFAEKLKNDKIFQNINYRFIVVSGDSDDTCPDDLFDNENDFKQFIENNKIIHWYAQNCVRINHNKLSQIPIGLGYHHLYNEEIEEESRKIVSPIKQEAVLDSIIQKSKTNNSPFWKRELKCYINFNFESNYMRSRFGYDRYEAIKKIPENLSFSEKGEVDRTTSWNNQSKYSFVVSPFGNGYECHRTWEALVLGCIPIVKTSGIDSLYEDLPVLIVNDWIDISSELLLSVLEDFKKKHEKGQFNYNKLTLKYWMNKINSDKII